MGDQSGHGNTRRLHGDGRQLDSHRRRVTDSGSAVVLNTSEARSLAQKTNKRTNTG